MQEVNINYSNRQRLYEITGYYLKESYANKIMALMQDEYTKSNSSQDFNGFVKQWYLKHGYHKIKNAIKHIFPETNKEILTESKEIWFKYTQIIEKKIADNCEMDCAVYKLAAEKIPLEKIREVLYAEEEEQKVESVSWLVYHGKEIREKIIGIIYTLTHWK